MRILLVKMSSLGDIIHAFPTLEFLKQVYPHAKIDWVVENAFGELLESHPLINQVFRAHTKKWRSHWMQKETWKEISQFRKKLQAESYDLVIDLQGNVKSAFSTYLAKSQQKVGFGYSSVPEWPNLLVTNKRFNPPLHKNVREDLLFIAQQAVQHFSFVQKPQVQLDLKGNEKKFSEILEQIRKKEGVKVMVCPGSNWQNKQLSSSTWKSFLELLAEHIHPHFVFIWGTEQEKEVIEEMASSHKEQSTILQRMPLPMLQNLMTHMGLILSMDSLPLHLAGTTSTPTFSVFGPSLAKKYVPLGSYQQHYAFQGHCPYGKKFEKRCDILRSCKTGACMKALTGEELFNQFIVWWTSLQPEQCREGSAETAICAT